MKEQMIEAFESQKFKVFSPFKCDISKDSNGNYVEDETIFAFAWFVRGYQAALSAVPANHSGDCNEMVEPTDISKQLREYAADSGYSHNDYADTMLAAASEIERCAARLEALQTQQPAQEPVGSDYTVLIGRLAYALKKANPESDLPIKATEFLKRKGHTFDPLRDVQEPVKQESKPEHVCNYSPSLLDGGGTMVCSCGNWK